MLRRIALMASVVAAVLGSGRLAPASATVPSPPRDYADVTFVPVVVDPVGATEAPPAPARPQPVSAPVVVTASPPAPRGLPTVDEAKAWVYATLGPTQGACLVDVVHHEDGTWDPHRTNPHSGAYGIPQALPGTKMATAGADWRDNRITQLRWMVGYVNGRYGSSCAAAAFRDAHGWY